VTDEPKTLEERAWEVCIETLMKLCVKQQAKAKSDAKSITAQRQIKLDAAKELGKLLKGKRESVVAKTESDSAQAKICDEIDAMASLEEIEDYLQIQLDGGTIDKETKVQMLEYSEERLKSQ